MAREGFVVYHELLKWLEPYGDAERGRLFVAMLRYSMSGEEPGLSGAERFIWPAIRDKIDRDKEAYESSCEKNRKNAAKRYEPEPATACDRMPPHATACDRMPNLPTETETETETKQKLPTGENAHARGEYGWVKLTDKQYGRLLQEMGQDELDRCIRYVDESAQKTGNKNKWKDWNLVIRNCHREGWGRSRSGKQYVTAQEYKPPTAINNSLLEKLQSEMGLENEK